MKFKYILILTATAFACTMCKVPQNTATPDRTVSMVQPLVVYKTTADYHHNTPITLNQEGTAIVGYPAPRDVMMGTELRTPIELADGYLLDRRGIGPTTAFLSLTYQEYAKLPTAPPAEELSRLIIGRNAIKEMWRCERKSSDSLNVQYANELINKGLLPKKCHKLK